jgi:hypothetical protein
MDVAALTRKYGSTVLGSLGVGLWLIALLLLASAAQNSQAFDRWLPWILLVNIAGLLTLLVLPPERPGLAPEGTHRRDLQRARRRADPGRLLLRADVPEPRHR